MPMCPMNGTSQLQDKPVQTEAHDRPTQDCVLVPTNVLMSYVMIGRGVHTMQ